MSKISAISKVLNKSKLPDELIDLIFEYLEIRIFNITDISHIMNLKRIFCGYNITNTPIALLYHIRYLLNESAYRLQDKILKIIKNEEGNEEESNKEEYNDYF